MRRIIHATAVWGLLIGTAAVRTQAAEENPMVEVKMRQMERAGNEELAARMMKELKLSADQSVAIQSALEVKTQKMSDLRKEFRAKIENVSSETEEKILAALTDEQKGKYASLKEKMAEEKKRAAMENPPGGGGDRRGPGGGRGGPGGGGPGGGGGFGGGHGGGPGGF